MNAAYHLVFCPLFVLLSLGQASATGASGNQVPTESEGEGGPFRAVPREHVATIGSRSEWELRRVQVSALVKVLSDSGSLPASALEDARMICRDHALVRMQWDSAKAMEPKINPVRDGVLVIDVSLEGMQDQERRMATCQVDPKDNKVVDWLFIQ